MDHTKELISRIIDLYHTTRLTGSVEDHIINEGGQELQDLIMAAHIESLPMVKHKKRVSTYRMVGSARLQDAGGKGIHEGAELIIYLNSGGYWAREKTEFLDGRFEGIK